MNRIGTHYLSRQARLSVAKICFSVLTAVMTLVADVASQEQQNMQAAPFTLKTLEGEEYSLQDFLNKQLVVVVFWSTWGKDSGRVLGDMESLFQRYGDRGLAVIGVCVEEQKISTASRQRIADSIQRNQITFPAVLDEGLQTFRAYSVVAVPTTYVTDEKRKILYKLSGYPISGRTALKDYIVEHFEGKKAVVLSATVKQPTNKEVIPLHKMARLKLEQGQLNLARKYAEKACSLDSLFAGTFALLAEIGIELDSVQLAEDAIRQVLLLTPHSVDALCLKGLLLAKKGNAREALDVLAPLARADSAATLTHCCFAYALGMNGAFKESLDEFAIAEAKSGSDYRIPLLRADVYEHHSKMKEAEADRKRAKKLRSQR